MPVLYAAPMRADRGRLLAAAALRATGTSLVGVLLGIYLAETGLDAGAIGAISTAGLAGAAVAALVITWWGDRWGRRRTLIALGLAGALAAAALLAVESPWAIGALAFLGMLNAMGRDRGAAAVLEQATLPGTVPAERRTLAFAWYAALQDGGHALGSLLAGLPALLVLAFALPDATAARSTLALYPLLLLAGAALYLRLSPAVEVAPGSRRPVSPPTRRILRRISALFAVDGIGGGFLVTTLLSYFFFERFGASPAAVAVLFFAARLANLLSNFGAAWLARRFGLVNTMVFTHIPASLLLIAVAFVPSFPLAAALFLLRECLVEMDVPTRQSYVMAVVAPEERTVASGVTNLVRLAGWATGPVLAGLAMDHLSLGAPLLLGAGIKIGYDLMLYGAFRRLRPPEERSG
jgi:MFS family permease